MSEVHARGDALECCTHTTPAITFCQQGLGHGGGSGSAKEQSLVLPLPALTGHGAPLQGPGHNLIISILPTCIVIHQNILPAFGRCGATSN